EWRRRFSLLLGLERLLSDDEPKLVDGTVLSAHQVDALSGTLTALLAEAQRNGPGMSMNGHGPLSTEQAATVEAAAEKDLRLADGGQDGPGDDDERSAEEAREAAAEAREAAALDDDAGEDEEPQDWQDDDE